MFVEPYMANVTIFGGTFAPLGWMFCDGTVLSISQYDALYALIGTTYGGDGQTTFALPDLRSRIAVHAGQAPGMSNYSLGQTGGNESVTLNSNQVAAHSHTLTAITGSPGASTAAGNTDMPTNNVPAPVAGSPSAYSTTPSVAMGPGNLTTSTIPSGGGSTAVPVISPYQAMNYIICVEGIFPSRN